METGGGTVERSETDNDTKTRSERARKRDRGERRKRATRANCKLDILAGISKLVLRVKEGGRG